MVEALRRRSARRYFTGQAPELASPARTVVAVGVEGRVNVNQIHAGVGQLGELFQIVAAVNDAGVEEGRWTSRTTLTRLRHPLPLPRARDIGRARHSVRAVVGLRGGGQGIARPTCRYSFRAGNLFCHARSLVKRCAAVNSPGQESGGWTFSGSLFRAVKLSQLSRPGSFTAFFPAATAP